MLEDQGSGRTNLLIRTTDGPRSQIVPLDAVIGKINDFIRLFRYADLMTLSSENEDSVCLSIIMI